MRVTSRRKDRGWQGHHHQAHPLRAGLEGSTEPQVGGLRLKEEAVNIQRYAVVPAPLVSLEDWF
jgi:hypothetical protein